MMQYRHLKGAFHMKNMLTVILILLLTLALTCALAEDEQTVYTSGDYEYILLADGTAEITGYYGDSDDLLIPAELDGHPVTSIGAGAFANYISLSSVTLPDGVISIGDFAFSEAGLYSITLPDTLVSIGDCAFDYCVGLTSVTLPDSLVILGMNPFNGCSRLTDVIVSPEHPVLEVLDGMLIDKSEKKLLCVFGNQHADSCTVPQGILMIGDYAVSGRATLNSINLPDSLVSIGECAFLDCISLTSVTLPEGVVSIGGEAFSRCRALTSVTLPDSLVSVGILPFSGCRNLTDVIISPEHPVLEIIDGVLFNKAEQKLLCCIGGSISGSYAIPQGVTSIGDYAFYGCSALESITLPDSVTSIGECAFYDCDALTRVTLPDGVVSIGDEAFCSCGALTRIVVPASVTSIGEDALSSRYPRPMITVVRDSFAEQWCQDNGFRYNFADVND